MQLAVVQEGVFEVEIKRLIRADYQTSVIDRGGVAGKASPDVLQTASAVKECVNDLFVAGNDCRITDNPSVIVDPVRNTVIGPECAEILHAPVRIEERMVALGAFDTIEAPVT
jgi:hypothetical protein